MTTERTLNPYDQGRKAFLDGSRDCPYEDLDNPHHDEQMYHDWWRGYDDEYEAQEAEEAQRRAPRRGYSQERHDFFLESCDF